MSFPEILSRNGQKTLKEKVNDPHFEYHLWEYQDAHLVQMWWLQLKSVISYRTDKSNF